MRGIICGAGISGLSLAWWLDRAGWDVLVIERTLGLRDEGYMIDFLSSGYDVAELMGLIPRLKEIHYPIPEMIYVDRNGRRVAGLDYKLFYQLQKGRVFNFMRGDLERVLFEELPESVDVRFGLTIDQVKPSEEYVEVLLSNEEHERADLLVGADGIHSRVRKLVFGEEHQFLRPWGSTPQRTSLRMRSSGGNLGASSACSACPIARSAYIRSATGRSLPSSFIAHQTRRCPHPTVSSSIRSTETSPGSCPLHSGTAGTTQRYTTIWLHRLRCLSGVREEWRS